MAGRVSRGQCSQVLLLVLAQMIHVEVAGRLKSVLVARRQTRGDSHCLVENVPECSTVASHKLLPTEGYDWGDYGTAEHGDKERTDDGGFRALSCFDASGEGENFG